MRILDEQRVGGNEMTYKQIAVNPLIIVILMSVSYLNIGGCGGGDGGCDYDIFGTDEGDCEKFAVSRECNRFDYNPGFSFLFPAQCSLYGCNVCPEELVPAKLGFLTPNSIAVTADGNFVVSDIELYAILYVDQYTGDRTIISYNSSPDRIEIANDGNFVGIEGDSVVLVDRNTGESMIISSDFIGSGPGIVSPHDIAVAEDGYFVLNGDASLLYVDQITGNRTTIFDVNTGNGPLNNPYGITLTPTGEIVITDQVLKAVVRVDQATGDRTIISDDTVGIGPGLEEPWSIAVTSDGDFVVIDNGLRAVVRVDQHTGDRTIISDDDTGSGP